MNDGARRFSSQLSRNWVAIDNRLVRDQELRKSLRRLQKERKRWRRRKKDLSECLLEENRRESKDKEESEEDDDEVRKDSPKGRSTNDKHQDRKEVDDTPSTGATFSSLFSPGTSMSADTTSSKNKSSRTFLQKQEHTEALTERSYLQKSQTSIPTSSISLSQHSWKRNPEIDLEDNKSEILQAPDHLQASACTNKGTPKVRPHKNKHVVIISDQKLETLDQSLTTAQKGDVEKCTREPITKPSLGAMKTKDIDTDFSNKQAHAKDLGGGEGTSSGKSQSKSSMHRKTSRKKERHSAFLEEQEKLRKMLLEATRRTSTVMGARPVTFNSRATKGRHDTTTRQFPRECMTSKGHVSGIEESPRLKARTRTPSLTRSSTLPSTWKTGRTFRRTPSRRNNLPSRPSSTSALPNQDADFTKEKSDPVSPSVRDEPHPGKVPIHANVVRGNHLGESADDDPLSKPPDTSKVRVPMWLTLLIMTAYILGGAVMFTIWEQDWNFLEGSYFCFITLSTIGFGDFVPGTSLDSWAAQEKWIMCCFYLLFGMAMQAMCFHLMQEEVRDRFRSLAARVGLINETEFVLDEVEYFEVEEDKILVTDLSNVQGTK